MLCQMGWAPLSICVFSWFFSTLKLQVNHSIYSSGFCRMDQKHAMGINWTISFRTRVDGDREGSVLGNPLFEKYQLGI